MKRKKKLGSCYESAANFLIDAHFAGAADNLKLVHGRVRQTVSPFAMIGHAWIEDGDVCIDTEKKIGLPRFLYYAIGQIKSENNFYYSFEQTRNYMLKFKHYGPWEGPEKCDPLK